MAVLHGRLALCNIRSRSERLLSDFKRGLGEGKSPQQILRRYPCKADEHFCRTSYTNPLTFSKGSPGSRIYKIPQYSCCSTKPNFSKRPSPITLSQDSTRAIQAASITGKRVSIWRIATDDAIADRTESFIASLWILWIRTSSEWLGDKSRKRLLMLPQIPNVDTIMRSHTRPTASSNPIYPEMRWTFDGTLSEDMTMYQSARKTLMSIYVILLARIRPVLTTTCGSINSGARLGRFTMQFLTNISTLAAGSSDRLLLKS